MKKSSNSNQRGFTILELMIATAVFSVLLAVCMAAFLQIGRMFVKGVNISLTQEDSRNIIDSISNDIRFSGETPDLSNLSNGYFCVGVHRYKFNLFEQIGQPTTPYGLTREDVGSSCLDPNGNPGTNPVEMLDNGMQLNKLNITCSSSTCNIAINLVFYGSDPTVLSPNAQDPNAVCIGALAGSQFCATTSYTTTVLQSFQ